MLTLEEIIDQMICDEGIAIEEDYMENQDGEYFKTDRMRCPVITINKTLRSSAKRTETKAHELGHHKTGVPGNLSTMSFATQEKCEALARRWEIEYLMPIERLIGAFNNHCTTPIDIADYFSISIEELFYGLNLYYSIYGTQTIHGQYVITWNPFNVNINRKCKK